MFGAASGHFPNHREKDYLWLEEKTNSGRKVELKDEREKNPIDLQVKSCLKLVLFLDSPLIYKPIGSF